jgi:5-methylcytosine-specific restriction endonuclease McrA
MGKRTEWNKEANKILKDKFEGAGITFCEVCGSTNFLTYAHKLKRRHMNSVEELSDINNVLLLCVTCHQKQEFDKDFSDKLFSKLRHG